MSTLASMSGNLVPRGRWRVDAARSRAGFRVRKLGGHVVDGGFGELDGEVTVAGRELTAAGSVRVASIDTGNADRDAHLRAPSFFDADGHPEIHFEACGAVPVGRRSWRVDGTLTIRGRTRPAQLSVTQVGPERLLVRGEIDRRDFGLTWGRVIEATGAVSPTVALELDLSLAAAG
jgi:polyisoprenoid-binding protein YceI